MSAFYYLLEANAYLVVFYAFYKLALQKETFYTGNRVYLVCTTMLAYIMPFIGLSGLQAPVQVNNFAGVIPVPKEIGITDIALVGYLGVSVALLLLFGLKLLRIRQLIKGGNVQAEHGIYIVSNPVVKQAFSFMNYLFLNPATERTDTVIRHEQTHIRQRHSLDLLFFELVQLSSWFNPILILMKRDIRALHEFIADEEAASYENNAGEYAMFLIRNSYGTSQVLGNTMFNQSLLKMRIMKLNQKRSPGQARMKFLPVLLLAPGMLAVATLSSARPSALVDLMPKPAETERGVYISPLTDTVPKVIEVRKSGSAPKKITLAKKSIQSAPPKVVEVRRYQDVPPPPPPRPPKKGANAPAPPKVEKKGDVPPPPPPPKPAKKGNVPAPPPPPENPKGMPPPPPPPAKKKSGDGLEEVTVVGYPSAATSGKPAAKPAGTAATAEVVVVGKKKDPSEAGKPAKKQDQKN